MKKEEDKLDAVQWEDLFKARKLLLSEGETKDMKVRHFEKNTHSSLWNTKIYRGNSQRGIEKDVL